MRSGPSVCIPGIRQGAGRGGKTDTCRSCRLHRSLLFLGCISPALALRASIFRVIRGIFGHLLGPLAGIFKLEATLNGVPILATECADSKCVEVTSLDLSHLTILYLYCIRFCCL